MTRIFRSVTLLPFVFVFLLDLSIHILREPNQALREKLRKLTEARRSMGDDQSWDGLHGTAEMHTLAKKKKTSRRRVEWIPI